MNPTSLTEVALGLWANPQTRLSLVLIALAAVAAIALRDRKPTTRQPAAAEQVVSRPANTPLLRRLWWRARPPHDLMRVDGLAIDRTRRPHCAWLGPTGAGKSASVATVRCDGKRVYFAVTPDLSDPLIAATLRLGGFHWTAGVSTVAIDFMPRRRSPNEVAEYLTEVFRSGGTGAWKRRAYLATAEVVRRIDEADEPRSFGLIAQRLKEACAKDRELKMVCEGWIGRFESVAEKFGSSAGAHGVDLADLIRRRIPILLDNDAFRHPGLVEDVVALGLAEAKIIADECPNGFRLIFEEAGQLGDRIELAYPFFRAGRRRNIAVDVLTQAESDLKYHNNDAITANLASRVYFGQEEEHLQKLAANRLGIHHSELDVARMRDFTAYISHGRIRRLVRFPKPPKTRSQRSLQTDPYVSPYEDPDVDPNSARIIIREISREREDYPALPPPTVEVLGLLERFDRSGHCHLWTGPRDKDGYGITDWNGKRGQRVHRIMWELTYGPIPCGPDGKPLDLDHQCRTRLCGKVTHLEPVTRAENVRRRWRVRGVSGT